MTTFLLTRILPLLVIFGVAAFGVHKYNDGLREDGRIEGRAGAKAESDPVIQTLAEWVVDRDAMLAKIADEQKKLGDIVVIKQKELNNALSQNKAFSADLAKLRGADAEFNRVLNTISGINSNASGASASARLVQLGAAHSQCERALRESDSDLADTLGRLDEALSVVRALKLK